LVPVFTYWFAIPRHLTRNSFLTHSDINNALIASGTKAYNSCLNLTLMSGLIGNYISTFENTPLPHI